MSTEQPQQTAPVPQWQPILINGGSLAVLSSLGTMAAFFATILLARALGAANYGIFSTLTELFILLVIPTQIGLPLFLVKASAANLESGHFAEIKRNLRVSWLISLGLSGLTMIFLVMYWLFSGNNLLLWGLLIIPITSIQGITAGALRGLHKVVLGKLSEMLLIQFFFLLLTGLAYLIDPPSLDLSAAFRYLIIAQTTGLAVTGFFLLRAIPPTVSMADLGSASGPRWHQIRPFFFLDAIFTLMKRAPIVLAAAFLLPNEVGNFKLALQMVGLSEFGLRVFNPLLAPQIAGMYRRGDRNRLQSLATISTRAILVANGVIALLFVFFGKQLIQLVFGSEFAPAYGVLLVLLVGQIFNSLTGAAEIFLLMTGLENDTAWFKGLCLALLLGAISIGARFYGTVGAAIGMSLAMMVWNLGLWSILFKHRQINTLPISWSHTGSIDG